MEDEGTWFVQELKKVFIQHAEEKPWSFLRQKINKNISEKCYAGVKMMSDGGLDTLTKEIHFNPGRPYYK